jgi:outer membrane protein assembly factor BamD (BamD/ComL family)
MMQQTAEGRTPMADFNDFDERGALSRSRRAEAWLEYGGWVIIGIALGWGIYSVVQISRAEEASMEALLATLARMFGGIVAGVLLWGMAEIIRRLLALQQATEQSATSQRDWSAGRPGAAASGSSLPDSDTLDELVVLMREVRDISLLSDEQRALRLQAQGKAVLNLLQREVPVLLREHNWIEARNRVEEARERFPSFSEWDALEKQIEQMRAQVEAHDIEAAERQVDDLTSLGAWDRVAEVVHELLERHPDSVKANELAQRLRVQRNKAEAEQRARLMAQAQEASNNREWRTALATATSLIQRFPKSPEAQALRLQLPTLHENAEIQIRQGMEAEIRAMIKEQRFDEALRVAHELLQQYPNSPQAAVLREQLPRLQDKAAAMGFR